MGPLLKGVAVEALIYRFLLQHVPLLGPFPQRGELQRPGFVCLPVCAEKLKLIPLTNRLRGRGVVLSTGRCLEPATTLAREREAVSPDAGCSFGTFKQRIRGLVEIDA